MAQDITPPRKQHSAKGPLAAVLAVLSATHCAEKDASLCSRGLSVVQIERAGEVAYTAERLAVTEASIAERAGEAALASERLAVEEASAAERLAAGESAAERLAVEEAEAAQIPAAVPTARPAELGDPGPDLRAGRGDAVIARPRTELDEAMAIRAYADVSRGLIYDPSAARDLALEVIGDVARHRPNVVLAKLERLTRMGKQLSPEARGALRVALQEDSAAVAARVEAAIEASEPLQSAKAFVTADRGHLILTRDIADLPRVALPTPPADLAKAVVYVDDRLLVGREGLLLVGREGLLLDSGDAVARWSQLHHVKLVELERDAIGTLPDRFVDSARGVTMVQPESSRSAVDLLQVPRVIVMLRCDHGHPSSASSDAC